MPAMKDPTARETASSPTAAARLLFLNGVHEIDAGEVSFRPGFDFRWLQAIASDRIGVPPEQSSLFLSHPGRKSAKKSPIDDNTDFASLVRTNKEVVFLALLKQAKKDLRMKVARSHVAGGGYFPQNKKPPQEPPEKTILKRPSEFHGLMGPFNYRALRNLQQQRERYLLSTAPAAPHPYPGPAEAPPADGGAAAAVCGVCSAGAELGGVAFHSCVHDRVLVVPFRSPVGPIQRPLPQARPTTPFSLLS